MARDDLPANSIQQSVIIRALTASTGLPNSTLTFDTSGLEIWYLREGELRVVVTLVDLATVDAPYASGGFIAVADGYYRFDVPDAALIDGVSDLQIGGSGVDIVFLGTNINFLPAIVPIPVAPTPSPGPASATRSILCPVVSEAAPDSTHEGCTLRLKQRHFVLTKGQCGDGQWELRWPDGVTADLSDCINDELSVSASEPESLSIANDSEIRLKVRFQGCDRGDVLAEGTVTVVDAANGLVQFAIPKPICCNAGIYQFQIGMFRDGVMSFSDGGLIDVEPGMWGNTDQQTGPPTLEEIRMHLRDRPAENDLLRAVEFDDAEILNAIKHPVMQWNETPPDLIYRFNCNNFPFRHHWRNAIVAELLRTAVHSYSRNKMQATSSGLTVDDKNKDREYLVLLQLYTAEWETFIARKKAEINVSEGFGSMASDYSS